MLLDTHTWLWLNRGVELDADTVDVCDEAAATHSLYLSPFSVWEIAMKASRGKLALPQPYRVWLAAAIRTSRVRMALFDFEVAEDAATLPEGFHKDPTDRALAATCRIHQLTLLTRDGDLLKLAEAGIFSARKV